MKEASTNIATPTVQKSAVPFFQRSADGSKEDSNFFSQVQTKLTVGAKDDPLEKEADSMADKVTSQSAPAPDVQTKPVADADNSIQSKACDPCTPSPVNIQPRFESDNAEEKLQKKEEDNSTESTNKNPVAADGNSNGSVQRYYSSYSREVEEADQIFRDPDPNVAGMSKRDAVIAVAKTMLGKIKAKQPGGGGERFGAKELWEIFKLAAPGVWPEDQIKTFGQPFPHWCGIFTVWAHKKAGIDLGNWQIGRGVSAFGTLKETGDPQPGDIGYIHSPNQHHALITKVGANIESIDGNSGLFSEVIENTRPRSAYTTFYTGMSGAASSGTASPKKEEGVQAKGDGTSSAPSTVESGISSTKGRGNSLSPSVQSEMQSGLGGDFSKVKIHTDSNAVQMNKDLKAQAFAHGGDVYFNENKFNPGTSAGKHLLAHELTHTIQQGAAPSVQKKASKKQIQQKKTDGTPVIQKGGDDPKTPAATPDPPEPQSPPAPAATPDDAAKLADPENIKKEKKILDTGKMTVNGGKFELNLKNFPLKQYASDKDAEGKPLTNIEIPKPGTRDTKQGKLWRDNMKAPIEKQVDDKIVPAAVKDKPELELSLTNASKEGRDKTKFFGDLKALKAEILVPFWTMKGAPTVHQIEHKIDWQILGNGKCDEWDNFLLLDMGTNIRLGIEVAADMKARIKKVLDHYRDVLGIKNVTPDPFTARRDYKVVIENFIKSKTRTRSIIDPNDMKPEGKAENPIKTEFITIKEAKRPDGHFIFKTSEAGAGAVLPFNFENSKNTLKFEGEIDKKKDLYEIKKITLTKMVRDKGVLTGATEPVNIEFTKDKDADGKDKDNYFRLNKKGYAYSIKNKLKVKDLSQVVLDDDPTLDVHEGVSATGKVISEISFLKDANIEFGIVNSDFFIRSTISPGFLHQNKKIPKPFTLEYGSITIEANSNDGLKVEGEIGFGVEKLGKGSVKVGIGGKGSHASGKFIFDKSVFEGELSFKYEEKKWTIGGKASMNGKKIKGIEKADISFEYSEESKTLTIAGNATLKLPGLSTIAIKSIIGEDGDFEITTTIGLTKIPRIISGDVEIKIAKNKDTGGEWDLAIKSDNIVPDFSYGGLKVTKVAFNYHKGAYDINISASYGKENGRIKSTKLIVGATNKPIGTDGKPGEGEPGQDITFYGEAAFEFKITDDIVGEIDGKLKPDGDIEIKGGIEVKNDKPLLPEKKLDHTIVEVDKNIPLASCIVVTLRLHLGGALKLYALLKPLELRKGSKITIGNLSLKDFKDPHIDSEIILGSHLTAGAKVELEIGLDVSLLYVINGQVGGKATIDFAILDADVEGKLAMGWSPSGGFELKEASISLDMQSKLKINLDAYAKVYLDLFLTTITLWDHTWPGFADEFGINLFEKGKKTWKFPASASGNNIAEPDLRGKMKDQEAKATEEEVQKRALNRVDGKGQTAEDKQPQMQKITQDEVLAGFRAPRPLVFNTSEDYSVTRYGLYNYLKENQGKDEKLDLAFIDEEIRKCETEEYEAFTVYIMGETGFDDNAKATIIEDFIVNHPSLGDTEIINLRSLIPVKAPASDKAPVKERGKTVTKKTPAPQQKAQSKAAPKVQTKAKPGGSSRSSRSTVSNSRRLGKNNNAGSKKSDFFDSNEGMEMDADMMLPDMELTTVNGFYDNEFEDAVQDDATSLNSMNEIENGIEDNEDTHFKPFYMRPYTRTRKPLQQQAAEKSKDPFFSGPEKKEKSNNGAFFQAKLNVGEADDPMEKEADKMADTVTGKGEKKEDRKDDIGKAAGVGKPEQEANKGKTPGADKPAIEEKKEDKKAVQKKGKKEEKEEESKTVVSKKDNAAVATPAAPKGGRTVESAIGEKNGHGASMPASTLQEMQSEFGKDFSDVRIHTDSDAAMLSDELDAQAFTTGKDIYFNSGKFDPESESGKHLLAHELTHVVQQNKDTIRRDPKSEKEEKNRAQTVRDNYQKALKAKTVNWETVAQYFNAFNEPEQRQKMAQLSGPQLFKLHQGAINVGGGGPYCAAALITTPVPGMDSAVAAAIETQMIHYNYQAAIDLAVEDLDKRGAIDRSLLTAGRMLYLEKKNISGEGRVVAPGFDPQTGKSKSADANIGGDAFSPSAGLPLLITTIIHEFQHVHQMQKKDESKALIPDQGNDASTHLQQEVEAYATEMVHAKETGLFNQPDQIEDAWGRLQSKWEQLIDDRKKPLNDLYKKAYEVAKQAVGKSLLVYTPMKP